jgi:hypothetical protein
MTKKERIAALEKTVADLAAKVAQQDKMIMALASRYPATQTFEAPPGGWPRPLGYDPITCASGDPPGTVFTQTTAMRAGMAS